MKTLSDVEGMCVKFADSHGSSDFGVAVKVLLLLFFYFCTLSIVLILHGP